MMITELLTKPANGHHPTIPLPNDDEFPYGWRNVEVVQADGSSEWDKIPLAPEDFLNPQLGDYMPQDPRHAHLALELQDKLATHLPTMTVLFDSKMVWGMPGLAEPFPDVTVIPKVLDIETLKGSVDCVAHGVLPCLIIEIMSPQYVGDDTKKVEIYERAGVTEYIIINPHHAHKKAFITLIGYRLTSTGYQPISPDAQGALLSQTTGVKFMVDPAKRNHLILLNAINEQPLLTHREEQTARYEAESRAHMEAQARLKAETQAQVEAKARLRAETEAQQLAAQLAQLQAELARLRGEN